MKTKNIVIASRRQLLKKLTAIFGASLIPSTFFAASNKGIDAPRIALIIGNSKYPDSPLINPVNDATAMGKELTLLGFNSQILLNSNLNELVTAVENYSDQIAKSKAVCLFYYAGHGVQLGWRNYLVPVDANIDRVDEIPQKTFELNTMLISLGKAKNPMNIIILDACRDNPFGKKLPPEQKGLSQFDAPPNSLLCYSTAPGNVASDGDGVNGLFTENLLREMRNPEAKIEDVFKRVRLRVRLASKGQQIPWESTSLEDDFYFNTSTVDSKKINSGLSQEKK